MEGGIVVHMTYDFSALNRPMTLQDVEAYRARFVKKMTTVTKVIIGFIIVVAIMILGAIALNTALYGPDITTMVWIGVFALVAVGVAGASVARRKRLTRLLAFATANNIQLVVDHGNPAYPGIIFSQGHSRSIQEAFVFPNGFEIGNYTYSTGSGKQRRTYNWSYMRVKLVRRLPHMLLDARKNNMFNSSVSNLPVSLTKDQAMRLEGNFNDYFTLYAPKGYEADALYVFTPDVLAALVDFGASHDIEVVDDDLIFYQRGSKDLTKEASLRSALTILDKVSSEIIDQGDYYADARVGNRAANVIAAPGQRLRSRVSIVTVIIVVLFLAYFASTFFIGFTR